MFQQRFTGKESPILGFLLCNRYFPSLDPMNLPRERPFPPIKYPTNGIDTCVYVYIHLCRYMCTCIQMYV